MKFGKILCLCLSLFFVSFLNSAFALDSVQIHKHYMEGDFDRLALQLEDVLHKSISPVSLSDSLLCLSYLAFIYGSYPEERSKGEAYLTLLYQKKPKFALSQFMLSDELEVWAEGVRGKVFPVKSNPTPLVQPKALTRKEKTFLASYATGGGVLLAFGTYILWQYMGTDSKDVLLETEF